MSELLVPTLLILEDSKPQTLLYEEYLRPDNYKIVTHATGREALETLRQFCPSAMLLDLHLPDANGLDILKQVRVMHPRLPVVIVTGDTSSKAAVDAMAAGAFDFILKPFHQARLRVTLHNALETQALEKEVLEWRKTLGQVNYHGFVGHSPPMQAIYRIIDSVAASKASVFITGESGTGKELVAHALHQASARRSGEFVAINCGAIPHELLESTLFGHAKGAFTGAIADHLGAAKKADGGTLFLDEVAELSLNLQVKLLRFLQTGEVTPVGSTKPETLDVRIVAATNRKPMDEIKAGRLREDLYYRLHVVPIDLPPLREREGDIDLLAEYFRDKFNVEEGKQFQAFAPDVMARFRGYEWPGNVRQLENVVRTAIVLNDGETLSLDMFANLGDGQTATYESRSEPNSNISVWPRPMVCIPGDVKPLWQVEKDAIQNALALTAQDVAKAAALLEVSPSTLYRKLQQWRLRDSA